jgi:hypothetical protein
VLSVPFDVIPQFFSAEELKRLTELIYPEEHWAQFADHPWHGEGFRHYLDPNIVCIEHYMPKDRPILPTVAWEKPAA